MAGDLFSLAREKLLPVRNSEEVVRRRLSVVRERRLELFLMLAREKLLAIRNSGFSRGIGVV